MHVSYLKLAGVLFNAVLSLPSSGSPATCWAGTGPASCFGFLSPWRAVPGCPRRSGSQEAPLNTLARIFEQAPAKLASGLLPGGPCPHGKFRGVAARPYLIKASVNVTPFGFACVTSRPLILRPSNLTEKSIDSTQGVRSAMMSPMNHSAWSHLAEQAKSRASFLSSEGRDPPTRRAFPERG